jgi:hypothetical protein
VFFDDLNGFNNASSSPPVIITFDDIILGTNITGSTIEGVTFELDPSIESAPLLVVKANDTHSLPGYWPTPSPDNRLFATSGDNILSPGGVDLAPGPNDTVEKDNIIVTFTNPVFAVGFDVLFQSMDTASYAEVMLLDSAENVLYYPQGIPTTGNGTYGGSVFVGFVSNSSNIKKIIIIDSDNNNVYADNNIGLDTIRLRVTAPTVPSSPQNLVATAGDAQVTLTWSAPASDGGVSITAYKVYQGMSSGGEILLTTLSNVLTYTDTSLTNGQTYYYKVSANNSVGEGAQTAEVVATPAAPSPSGGDDMTLMIAILAVAVLAGVGVAVLLKRKKKK